MVTIIENIIRGFVYIIFFVGLWLLVGRFIPRLFKKEDKSRFGIKNSGKSKSEFDSHIRLLLYITFGIRHEDCVFYFTFLSIILFLFTFIILIGLYGFSTLFLISSIFAGILPYTFLRIKLKSMQLKGSYEAVELISEISNSYKLSNYNMQSAIDKSVANMKEGDVSRRALFHLSLSLKDYKDKEELQKVIDGFASVYDTEWATILGINIFEAILNGTNVEVSLDDLLSGMKDIKSSIEKDKRANQEAFTMVKFVTPLVYVFTIIISVEFFGFTVSDFLYFQFRTSQGAKLFSVIIIIWLISYVLMFLLSRPKFDY
jgi:hypothetical protein